MPKIGFIKLGNLGISQIIDLLLDEMADRNVNVRTVGTGAKMGLDEADWVEKLMEWHPDLVIIVTPNPSLPGPTKAGENVRNMPCVVVSDGSGERTVDALKKDGFGYIILKGDPLIGARREFLDPTEMALFNSDVLRVLTICGAVRLVQEELDTVIGQIQHGKKVKLPQIIADSSVAVERAGFSNPYAKAKALAAYQMAEKATEINTRACFVLKNAREYIMAAASAHELMRAAALLADEAREIEKWNDEVLRRPHDRCGATLAKRGLLEKLQQRPSA